MCLKLGQNKGAACQFREAWAQVWNVNRYSGIVGAFHLQGASWSRTRRQFLVHDETPPPLATQVRCHLPSLISLVTRLLQRPSVTTQLQTVYIARCACL